MMRPTRLVKPNTTTRSRSARAGLVFPVGRILRYMKKGNAFRSKRIATKASVYLSAVIEYVTRELSELAGLCARDNKRKLITPRDIMLSVVNDHELLKCLSTVMFPFSGTVPCIYAALVPSKPHVPRSSANKNRQGRTVVRSTNAQDSNPTLATLSERFVGQNTKLVVVRGTVTSTPGTVVVHPTSTGMSFTGQVGRALLSVGGQQLAEAVQNEIQANGSMDSRGVRLMQAPGLPFDYVLHCDSPSFQASDPDLSKKELSDLIEKCLRACDERGLPHLVLPSVGSGNCHYPKQLAAETILNTIKTYCDINCTTTKLKTIKFVLYDQESVSVYCSELARLQ